MTKNRLVNNLTRRSKTDLKRLKNLKSNIALPADSVPFESKKSRAEYLLNYLYIIQISGVIWYQDIHQDNLFRKATDKSMGK